MSIHGGRLGLMTGDDMARMPYPSPFSRGEQLAIEEAIRTGFAHVVRMPNVNGDNASEVEFTRALVKELNRMMNEEPCEVPGFSAALLETVSRGEELESYNGQHVEKRPDMAFRRLGRQPPGTRRELCGIFVECKIVDKQHTMKRYCGEGITRFVEGEYAWAMTSGMLIGYARDDYSLPDKLAVHLQTYGARYNTNRPPRLRDNSALAAPLFVTIHNRAWHYPSGGLPGDIELLHLWLSVHEAS